MLLLRYRFLLHRASSGALALQTRRHAGAHLWGPAWRRPSSPQPAVGGVTPRACTGGGLPALLPRDPGLSLLLKGRCMARGRTTSFTIRLTPAERLTLLAWQRSTTVSA